MEPAGPGPRTSWTFVTNHARILAMILKDPQMRLRDVAQTCRITERAAQAIVTDLESAGYLTRGRNGRRNLYKVTPGTLFRHPAEGGHEVADLLHLLASLTSHTGTADQPSPDGDPRERGQSG
ncbi:MarR family transcriptional regulator [Streptomyces sp. WAC07061]|uniref:helix-turn-helix transcriptional regulator n=1 Tax=Streptomyces sp. WAC07061 TaxID=2487410 RepID=UPI000F768B6C|nr:winged helix-turn-helix domain-containing protein [Streptomyces sp. WAC07061]RSS46505.1 MarR family transcriptional regulator [Streptomyces sp. WAC07061]